MSSVSKLKLIDAATANVAAGTRNSLSGIEKSFIAVLKFTRTSGTLEGKIEHSPDGVTWVELKAFTGLAATGIEVKQITDNVLPHVRGVLSGTWAGTGTVELFFEESAK